MVHGDMCLKIMEKGVPKDVVIKEGEMFLLPAHIPHSPQRFENTVGLVVERERKGEEIDCLRWYTADSSAVLYEEWFHCDDLGVDLPPVIKRYKESDQFKSGMPNSDSFGEPAFVIDEVTEVIPPFIFSEWIDAHSSNIPAEGISVFPEKQEFQFILFDRLHQDSQFEGECLYWVWSGSAVVTRGEEEEKLVESHFLLLKDNEAHSIATGENTLLLRLTTIPHNY